MILQFCYVAYFCYRVCVKAVLRGWRWRETLYEAKNVPDGYTYEMIAKEHIVDSGIKANGTKGFVNKEMLKR